MKLNMIRIRKNTTEDSAFQEHSESRLDKQQLNNLNTTEDIHSSIKFCQENMIKLMSMFQTFLKVSTEQHSSSAFNVHQSQTYVKTQMHYQNRDRHVILAVPAIPDSKPTQSFLEKWFTETAFAAFSSSFNFYLSEEMTFEQAKVFCSQTILVNLLRFTEKYPLSQSQMCSLNQHFSSRLLDYLQRKYPLTLSTDVNKALQKELHNTNNFDLLSNDFLYSNGIIFTYRESGNYNDIIMKVINKSLEIVDGLSTSDIDFLTNFQDFEMYMSSLFEKVYKEEWVNVKKSLLKAEEDGKISSEQTEKYAQKVKSYTNYTIGRKISENTQHFTQQQINSNNLDIKSPAILRILTKWCEQLWQKFSIESYYSQRAEPILLQDPQFINPFFKWMKTNIDKKMAAQKKQILNFKKTLDKHSNYQQSVILLKYLQQDQVNFIPKYQKAYGMFTSHMVKNLHSYIILYLNRLIHGLLTVSKLFYEIEVDKSWETWQSPPNLVTFKIGDLMRCKCSSREKEIIRIYREINSVSASNPQKMKIVRIKNRLREGTNDILINVKFNDLIICQIQLEVNNKSKSKFIQCSNAFSHYIYELRRSIFGPITQLCNIWNNFDSRSKTFNNLIITEQTIVNSPQKIQVPPCKQPAHKFQTYIYPFQCTICKKLYFHNNYIVPNQFCKVCQIYKCARCKIRLLSQNELKDCLFKDKEGKSVKSLFKITQTKLPESGACLKIESTIPKIQLFRKMTVETKTWLFGMNNAGQLYELAKVNSQKEINEFFRNYFVFDLTLDPPKQILISQGQANYFAVKQYFKDSYRREKEELVLTQIRVSNKEMNQLTSEVGNDKDKKRINRIQFASNYLSTFQFFAPFENLTEINLDYNFLSNTSFLQYFKRLEKLQIRQNSKLCVIGNQICDLQHLQEIKLNACSINTLPIEINKLKFLKSLILQKNKLKVLPQSICDIKNLKDLNLKNNILETLPNRIGQLTSLKKLNLCQNKLRQLPSSVQNLLNLVSFNISNNSIQNLPVGLRNMKKLQKFQANSNFLTEINEQIFEIQSLKTISINKNKLKTFNCNLAQCKNLQMLSLKLNQLTSLSETIGSCSNLVNLQLSSNLLQALPQSLSSLQKLSRKVSLKSNKFVEWPQFLLNFTKLQELDMSENQLTSIPMQICKLKTLDKLELSANKISIIPAEFTSMKYLVDFNLKNNALTAIPEFLLEFDCIKDNPLLLFNRLTVNHITQIPTAILHTLTTNITFTNNRLTAIPAAIQDKASVIEINLESNNIKQIPEFIKEFIRLNILNLKNNLIEVIPSYMDQLKNMRIYSSLFLENNPIKTIECRQFVEKYGSLSTKTMIRNILSTGQPAQKFIQLQESQSQSLSSVS